MDRRTVVEIDHAKFKINGEYTFPRRHWRGALIEGLLPNSRMVQAVFDDENPDTVSTWADGDRVWDADRNANDFIDMLPIYRDHGLLAVTINLQGGAPGRLSYDESKWTNSAFREDGSLKSTYMKRVEKVIDRADELGMVVILGYFYFGQETRLVDNDITIINAVRNATEWIMNLNYTNVMIEINNECNARFREGAPYRYLHRLLQPERVHELVGMVQGMMVSRKHKIPVSTSFCGCRVPSENILNSADYILVHGNDSYDMNSLKCTIDAVRNNGYYRGQPIVVNEDDHYDFEKSENQFVTCVRNGVSWGYFDFDGYQAVPPSWGIDTQRKEGFFRLLREITGCDRSSGSRE